MTSKLSLPMPTLPEGARNEVFLAASAGSRPISFSAERPTPVKSPRSFVRPAVSMAVMSMTARPPRQFAVNPVRRTTSPNASSRPVMSASGTHFLPAGARAEQPFRRTFSRVSAAASFRVGVDMTTSMSATPDGRNRSHVFRFSGGSAAARSSSSSTFVPRTWMFISLWSRRVSAQPEMRTVASPCQPVRFLTNTRVGPMSTWPVRPVSA